MLEAQLLVKLSEAKTLWETPPYYRNDAQDVIKSAISMAADTEWEERISDIVPEQEPYDNALDRFIHNHNTTMIDVNTTGSQAYLDWERELTEQGNRFETGVFNGLNTVIEALSDAIGDKIHRRNLQIADLKTQVSHTESTGNREYLKVKRELDKANIAIGDANIIILGILAEIDSAQGLDRSTETIKSRLYKISTALKI